MLKKALVAVVVLAGLLVLVLGVLLLVEFDASGLGKQALDRAAAAAGVQLEAQSFKLSLLRGLTVREVQARSDGPSGKVDFELDSLVFRHRLWPLLKGKVVVESVVLRKPRVRVVQGKAAPTAGPSSKPQPDDAPAVSGTGLALEVDEIRIEDARIELMTEGQPDSTMTLEGLDLSIRGLSLDPAATGPLEGARGEGELSIERIALASTNVTELAGRFGLDGGRFETKGVRFTTPEGLFEATLDVDLRPAPFEYQLALKAVPLDVNAMAAAGPKGGFGDGHLQLEGSGKGPDPDAFEACGRLRLEEGRLPSTPIFAGLEQAVGHTQLVGTKYNASETPFTVSRGRVSFQDFKLETDSAGIVLGGWVDLEGPLDLKMKLRTSREGLTIQGVPSGVLNALTDDEGFVVIPLRIRGTQAAPKVTPDTRALKAQARRGAGRRVKNKLSGLF